MKRVLLLFCGSFLLLAGFAQHCPWDCSGMVIVETPVAKGMIYKMEPVLVDEDKKVIVDTMYGTDKPTYDRCDFLSYDDFTKLRTEKIAIHHWYEYDTFYHFAAGNYIVKYNFCEYRDKKLFLRYSEPSAQSKIYHYIEIPGGNRIHLHDYNSQLRARKNEEIKNDLKDSVLVLSCKEWNLKEQDCK
ncbi:MAG TPA: hypothetical protein VGQ53_18280 [Chitinophagaceae bacterium]|jgi:hypothetical protein|nr:hypothetical protein [Chitinophagaceae bacterium]